MANSKGPAVSVSVSVAAAAATDALSSYREMRDFTQTPEPSGESTSSGTALSFVVQKHSARTLHYDFRLELAGTLKSWAVPKGPSLDPTVKRMAVQVEDHPVAYASFEGVIPARQYGAGTVILWDRGTWVPMGDPNVGYAQGKLKFALHGIKLRGNWTLVRMNPRDGESAVAWLLMKESDACAQPMAAFDVLEARPESVREFVADSVPPVRRRTRVNNATEVINEPFAATLEPQLATLVDVPPPGDWLYEIKFDGYRLLSRIDRTDVRCITRNGHDWSRKLPALVAALRALNLHETWLDGEIVVAGSGGTPDFQALQNAFDADQSPEATQSIRYMVFDLLFHEGRDLRKRPLTERRALLQRLIETAPSERLRFSESMEGDPTALLESARNAGLEGLMGKRPDSIYRSGRSTDWIKLKSRLRQEFVIGGYTDPKGARTGIGSLVLGVHDEAGALQHAGSVGTGFDERTLLTLVRRLTPLRAARSPFARAADTTGAGAKRATHWVHPRLVAEVSFAQWTHAGRVRHATFHGLRDDKPPVSITRERAMSSDAKLPAGLQVTHAGRVVDSESGVTKGELVGYYASVAVLMLAHLKDRPVALLRAPAGVGGPQFFQKHADSTELPGLQRLARDLDPGHEPLLSIGSADGLLMAAQLNVIEIHSWNMTTRAIQRPDRLVFDLDPGEGVAWTAVCEAAQLLRAFLSELGLKCFLKTSGGKGLHVVAPLAPRHEWSVVKQFAHAVVLHMAGVLPERLVARSGPKNRVGRIFIDYLRNGWGATTAVAWSARARPGMGVSVPVAWDELDALSGAAHWTVRNIARRLVLGNRPWDAYGASRQGLSRAMKTLGFTPQIPSTVIHQGATPR